MAFRSVAQPFCSHTTPEVAAHYICIPLLLLLCFGFRYILYTWMGTGDADGGCACPLGFTTQLRMWKNLRTLSGFYHNCSGNTTLTPHRPHTPFMPRVPLDFRKAMEAGTPQHAVYPLSPPPIRYTRVILPSYKIVAIFSSFLLSFRDRGAV